MNAIDLMLTPESAVKLVAPGPSAAELEQNFRQRRAGAGSRAPAALAFRGHQRRSPRGIRLLDGRLPAASQS